MSEIDLKHLLTSTNYAVSKWSLKNIKQKEQSQEKQDIIKCHNLVNSHFLILSSFFILSSDPSHTSLNNIRFMYLSSPVHPSTSTQLCLNTITFATSSLWEQKQHKPLQFPSVNCS